MPFSESKISKIQKIHQKRIGKKIYFFLFSGPFSSKTVVLMAYITMIVVYA